MKPGSWIPVKGFSLLPAVFLVLSGALLAACDGTSNGLGNRGDVAVGTIDAFGTGAVVVNGLRYITAGAPVIIDNAAVREQDLVIGMRVTVTGPFSDAAGTGDADRIEVERAVRGPLNDDGVDLPASRLRVLGQTVLVLPATTFDNVSGPKGLADIQDNNAVNAHHPDLEIHGAVDNTGVIHATYVRRLANDFPAGGSAEIDGFVTSVSDNTFRIGNLQIAFAGAGGLGIGQFVEARGTADNTGTLLTATSVQVKDSPPADVGSDVKLEGYVGSGDANRFTVIGADGPVVVRQTASTSFENGGRDNVVAGARLVVEGQMVSSGLSARRILFVRPSHVFLEGRAGSDPSVGIIPIFDLLPVTDIRTQFKDSRGPIPVRTFGIADIHSGDFLLIAGRVDNTAQIRATRVERITSPDNVLVLRGPVSDKISEFQMQILTMGIFMDDVTTDFFLQSGVPTNRLTFLDNVTASSDPDLATVVETVYRPPVTTLPPSAAADEARIVTINN